MDPGVERHLDGILYDELDAFEQRLDSKIPDHVTFDGLTKLVVDEYNAIIEAVLNSEEIQNFGLPITSKNTDEWEQDNSAHIMDSIITSVVGRLRERELFSIVANESRVPSAFEHVLEDMRMGIDQVLRERLS